MNKQAATVNVGKSSQPDSNMDSQFVQLHLDDENMMEPTEEVGAIGGIVPQITNQTTGPKETTCKKRQHKGKQCKEKRKLQRDLAHLSNHIAAPAPLPGLLGASPTLLQGAAAYVIPGPCIIMPLPQGSSAGSGTGGTSSLAPPTSYKNL